MVGRGSGVGGRMDQSKPESHLTNPSQTIIDIDIDIYSDIDTDIDVEIEIHIEIDKPTLCNILGPRPSCYGDLVDPPAPPKMHRCIEVHREDICTGEVRQEDFFIIAALREAGP